MQFSQSKGPSRGPLIAVIKIQLGPDKTDRIFLHQNDNDYLLAQEFQQKHNLKLPLIELIYQRIKLSRASLNKIAQYPTQSPSVRNYQQTKSNIQQYSPSIQNQSRIQSNYKSSDSEPEIIQHAKHFNNQVIPHKITEPKKQDNTFSKALIEQKLAKKVGHTYLNKSNNPTNINDFHIHKQSKYSNENQIIERSELVMDKNYKEQKDDRPSRIKIIGKDQISSIKNLLKRSLSKSQIKKITSNVTNRLYNQSEIKKNYLKMIKQKAQLEKDNNQKQELTHTPNVNRISSAIANDRLKDKPIYEHLIEQGRKSQLKKEQIKSNLGQRELNQCSFKPQLNQISKKLAVGRSVSDLAKPKTIIKNPSTQKLFKPQINKFSEEIIKKKGNFDQRLKVFLEYKNNKLNIMAKQKKIQQTIDICSGQQLFRPRVMTSSSHMPKGQNIGEYLYNLSKIPKNMVVDQPHLKINQNSEVIVQQMYIRRLAWIFSELDSDQDGSIGPKAICIDNIDDQLLQIIMPVLFEMEEMDIELNFNDFRKAIQNLHHSLTTLQKSILYDYNKKNI